MVGENAKDLAREFFSLRSMRKSLGRAVAHISISLSPEDRNLSDEEFSQVATTYLDRMGFSDCPFVAIRHEDTEHQHIHIVASRIKATNGEVVSDFNDFRRGEAVMRQIETDLSLKKVKSSKEATRKSLSRKELQLLKKGEKTMKQEMRNIIEDAINSSSNITEFIAHIQKLGITVCPHIQGSRISGLIYEWKARKAKFKGSDLGKKYTWAGIQEHVQYRPDLDFIPLNKLKREYENNHPSIELPESVPSAYRREYKRNILENDYRRILARIFEADLIAIQSKGENLEIELVHGRIIDSGEKITVDGMEHPHSAIQLVKLAKAKGWDGIVLTGSKDFVFLAMQEAIKADLPITPKDEFQKQLLAEAKATLNQISNPQIQPAVSPNQLSHYIPTLTPLKVGEWSNIQDQKRKKEEEEKKKNKKKYGYGW